jgi:hypothetical protein
LIAKEGIIFFFFYVKVRGFEVDLSDECLISRTDTWFCLFVFSFPSGGDGTQGLLHTRQALLSLSYIPQPQTHDSDDR